MSDFQIMGRLWKVKVYKLVRDMTQRWIERLLASQYGIVAGILRIAEWVAGLYLTLQDGELSYFGSSRTSEAIGLSNLTVAGLQNLGNNFFLNAILQRLSIVRYERAVLNPEKVMLAMALYAVNFKLTSQQDAAEALLHLLSSLEQELQGSYVSEGSSVSEITGISSKIYRPRIDGKTE